MAPHSTHTHSLGVRIMLPFFTSIRISHSLSNIFTFIHINIHKMNDILKLNTAISKLNKKDFSSDRYRYPYKKNGAPIPVEPVVFEIADKAPDLEKGIPYIIQSQHEVKIASKGSSLMMDIKTLFEEIEILFDISEAD